MEFRWYVAAALAGLEGTAIYYLSRAGIAAFSPTATDRLSGREFRLFPGYVFVELSAANPSMLPEFAVAEAGTVRRTRGIHALLPTHAAAPTPLPVGFVKDLRARMGAGDFDANAAAIVARTYAPKDDVPIVAGPWAGWTGEMVGHRKGSFVVLLALLGAKREVEIPRHQVFGGVGPNNNDKKRPKARPQYGRGSSRKGEARRVAA